MKEFVLAAATGFGALAILLGAFGAHALKKIFNEDQHKSFETGVKYQMYHALLLLITGFQFDFNNSLEKIFAWSIIFGILLFSFSIYGLCVSAARGKKWKFLGPITPLGGLLLLAGWIQLFFLILK